jgi:hypothetical protein
LKIQFGQEKFLQFGLREASAKTIRRAPIVEFLKESAEEKKTRPGSDLAKRSIENPSWMV